MAFLKADLVSFSCVNRFQRVDDVKNISCAFETGKAYAIVGKSGSGKTTLLPMLGGLENPTESEVLFEGTPLRKKTRKKQKYTCIGGVFSYIM